ncbi:MAG TPA: hypothetical protein VK211_28765 [Kamptonema sp.]|nr:hypothetical protein [Kamptonema sp.]
MKKNSESTTKSTRKLPPATIANYARGEQVQYVGQRYKDQYSDLFLVVDEIVYDGRSPAVACRKPDGSFTTWLNPDELVAVDRTSPQPIEQPTEQQPSELPTVITRADATKLKDIATTWWEEYYPEHIQSLRTQLFGWGSVGNRYTPETVFEWLKVQKQVVRDRLMELYEMAGRLPDMTTIEINGTISDKNVEI